MPGVVCAASLAFQDGSTPWHLPWMQVPGSAYWKIVLAEIDVIEGALELFSRIEKVQNSADLVGAHLCGGLSALGDGLQPETVDLGTMS